MGNRCLIYIRHLGLEWVDFHGNKLILIHNIPILSNRERMKDNLHQICTGLDLSMHDFESED